MTDIQDAVKQALESAIPGATITPSPAPAVRALTMPPHVATNLCKMLERVQMTGMEAVAWCEAYQLLQQFAMQGQGPGVAFPGLGK